MENPNGGMPQEPTVAVENSNAPVVENTQPQETQITPKEPVSLANKSNVEPIIAQEAKKTQEQEKYWSDDWKEKMSGGDEKIMKLLDKYKNPSDVVKSYKELETKFHKTRPLADLAKDATPEQVKEYREKAGIPETWDKYDLNLENGLVVNEADKPIVDAFLQKAHDLNLRPSEVKKSLQAYYEGMTALNAEVAQRIEQQSAEIKAKLQKDWGNEFTANANLIYQHIEKNLGTDEASNIYHATLPDGTPLMNSPTLLNFFLKQAKESGQSHTLTPNQAQDFTSTLSRKKEIESLYKENPKLFHENQALSDEYNKLLQNL